MNHMPETTVADWEGEWRLCSGKFLQVLIPKGRAGEKYRYRMITFHPRQWDGGFILDESGDTECEIAHSRADLHQMHSNWGQQWP